MSEQEVQYSVEEIDGVWDTLRTAEQELEQFENKDAEKKKELIFRIRDSVNVLVEAKKIPIKSNQISSYVLNILTEKGVSYSKGHWSELFKEHQKRNYSNSPKGEIHEHEFKLISETANGKWESCDCGANKINGIIQVDLSVENTDTSKKVLVREVEEPQGIEFEYLKYVKELMLKNIQAIDIIFQKCTLDITSIKKQTTENKKRKASQIEYDELLKNTKNLTDKRVAVVLKVLSDISESDIVEKKKSITDILNATKKLNDRTKITNYEKAVVKILINNFNYFVGDMATLLNVTTKHIKNNILHLNSTNAHDQDSILEQTDFPVRCPGCGVGVADYFENMFLDYKAGKSVADVFDVVDFPFPTFALQLIEEKQKTRKALILIKELKVRLMKKTDPSKK
jgi:hypothetical protein